MYLGVLWWALAVLGTSVKARGKPSVFVYDAKTLGRLGPGPHGAAIDAYTRIFEDQATVERLIGSDPDHGDAFIADEARRVLESRWGDVVAIAPSPDAADAILWLVWDYGFCACANETGAAATAVEKDKGRLKASCSSHIDLLRRVMATERWRRSGGRDHAFMVLQPHLWAHAATTKDQSATLHALVSSAATLVVIEERREARGNSNAVVMPYYAKRSPCPVTTAARPHFISYVDSLTCVRAHDNGVGSSTAIRATIRSSLAQCSTCVAKDILSVLGAGGGRHRCTHRNDWRGLNSKLDVGALYQASVFCPCPAPVRKMNFTAPHGIDATCVRFAHRSARRLRAHEAFVFHARGRLHTYYHLRQNGPALRRTRGSGVSRPADPREGVRVALAAAPLFAPGIPAERDRGDARASVHACRRTPPARRRARRRGADLRPRVQGSGPAVRGITARRN